eukprot:jgi/Chlat1/8867/Chrsp92S08188
MWRATESGGMNGGDVGGSGFGGLLAHGVSVKSRRQYLAACKWLCVLQLACGFGVAAAALSYLYSFTAITGAFVGGLLVVVGIFGLAGSASSDRRLLTLYLLGALLAMMLSFQFMAQVERQAVTDCTLAELNGRLRIMEADLTRQQYSQQFVDIVTRMDEVEDVLDFIAADKKGGQHNIHHQQIASDRAYISERLKVLKEHAEEIMKVTEDALELHANQANTETDPKRASPYKMTDEEHEMMVDRLNSMGNAIHLIDMHLNDNSPMDREEYLQIMEELAEMYNPQTKKPHKPQMPERLQAVQREIPRAHAAFDTLDRVKDDHQEDRSYVLESFRARLADKQQKYWQDEFDDEFAHHELDDLAMANDMPEHCVQESHAWKAMLGLGSAVIILQLLSSYCVLSLLFLLPVKSE